MSITSNLILSLVKRSNPEAEKAIQDAMEVNPKFKEYIDAQDYESLKGTLLEVQKVSQTSPEKVDALFKDINSNRADFDFTSLNADAVAGTINAYTPAPAEETPVEEIEAPTEELNTPDFTGVELPEEEPVEVIPTEEAEETAEEAPRTEVNLDDIPPEVIKALNKLSTVAAMDTKLENAFKHALTNDELVPYLVTKSQEASAEGSSSSTLLDSITESLVKTEKGTTNQFLDTAVSGPLIGVLNTIGNKEGPYATNNFGVLDNLGDAMKEHAASVKAYATRADTYKEENEDAGRTGYTPQQAQSLEILQATQTQKLHKMIDAVRAAGGEVNAFAKVDQRMMMQFMMDMLGPPPMGGSQFALDNLFKKSGMSEEQQQAMSDMIGPYMGLIEHAIGPYAQYFQMYGPELMNYGKKMGVNMDILNGEQPVKTVTASEPDKVAVSAEANATTFQMTVRSGLESETIEVAKNFGLNASQLEVLKGKLKDIARIDSSKIAQDFGIARKGATPKDQEVDVQEARELVDKARGELSSQFDAITVPQKNTLGTIEVSLPKDQLDQLKEAAARATNFEFNVQ